MNRKTWMLLAVLCVTVAVFVGVPDVAYAAPGGIIKAASKSLFGRIVAFGLCLILLPIIIWYVVRRTKAIRRTREALATLSNQFPQYRWLEVRDRVTEVFNWTWSAWTQQKMSLAEGHVTHWYMQNQQLQLDDWERRGVENVCHVEKINNIEPIYFSHGANGEGARLVLSIIARVVDYLRDKKTGKVVEGDTKPADLETIWTLIYQEGAWRLNLIESSDAEGQYLGMPVEMPAATAAPQAIR
jgi:hypothetical protein